MISAHIFLVFLWGITINVACVPIAKSTITLTPSITPTWTSTPTATVVWFPPTLTPTPFPAPLTSPTAEFNPNLGVLLLQDDFTSGEDWLLIQSTNGSIALGKNELTIHVAQPKTYLFSVRRQPILSDFYLEITASPTLCQDGDEYGVLFRATSLADYYRFGVSCDGQVKLERVLKDKPSVLQPWMESGIIPPGAPNIVHIGIWVQGKDMHFLVEGYPVFNFADAALVSGNLGVYARSASQTAMTVNFSELSVWEIK